MTAGEFAPSATRGQAVRRLARALSEAGAATPALDARLLCAAALGVGQAALLADADAPVGATGARRIGELAARRLEREPVARILGRREFWGLPFALTAETLEPRPDTETLVEAALARVSGRSKPVSLVDLGTGSGCLLVALLHELPAAWGLGVDRSTAALLAARANAREAGVAARAAFAAADWAAPIRGRFDLVVSNPPYIASDAIAGLAPEVARHDPRLALDGGPDGLAAYRAIFPRLRDLLAADGLALLEMGCDQGPALRALAAANGLAAHETVLDLAGRERVLVLG